MAFNSAVPTRCCAICRRGCAGWILRAGFSPGWGAFTFPLAAYANALFVTGFAWPGLVVTLGASALTLSVAARLAHGLIRSRPATAEPARPS